MKTSDFDYHLPEERIAQHPLARGESRLLVLDQTGRERHRRIAELPNLLRPGDLLVLNNTRVIPARLLGHRTVTGGRVEILLLERLADTEWSCLLKPGRRARPGLEIELGSGVAAEVLGRDEEGSFRLRFSEPLEPRLEALGHIPLPPYIRRPDTAEDRERYQTVYARRPGAIAAPTAGLHFSSGLMKEIADRGVELAEITLHVGIGTFRPMSSERVEEHRMDSERWEISEPAAAAIRQARERRGRIVAVGTTVVRTLESAAGEGDGEIHAGSGRTELFITPGFTFRAVDALLTNFHLPRSTLLMLVAALAGRERVLAAYEEAIREGYRFYSYGDAMWIERSSSRG